jgi:hypothetical protein
LSVTDSDNISFDYRLVVDAAECGFVISPIIENIFDISFVRDQEIYKSFQEMKNTPLRSCKKFKICVKHLKFFGAKNASIGHYFDTNSNVIVSCCNFNEVGK